MAEPSAGFGSLLRGLRREAGLTQEELAEAAALSVRGLAYLERGTVSTPQKETVRLTLRRRHFRPVRHACGSARSVRGSVWWLRRADLFARCA